MSSGRHFPPLGVPDADRPKGSHFRGLTGGHHRARARAARYLAAAVGAALVSSLVALLSSSSEISLTAGSAQAAAVNPPSVPGSGAYLGAFYDPNGTGLSVNNPAGETITPEPGLAGLQTFSSSLGRPLSVVQVYQPWSRPLVETQLNIIWASGAIPMVMWTCGDTDAAVVRGQDDQMLTTYAEQLASYGLPVLLDWFPNANDPSASPRLADPSYPPSKCLGTVARNDIRYRLAYQHIRSIFARYATNVSFVWSVPAGSAPTTWTSFYPGNRYVDWIAADGFDQGTNPPRPGAFTSLFAAWHTLFRADGKPMMISDTGATSANQQEWLSQVLAGAKSMGLASVVYFDAPYKTTPASLDFQLASGSAGLNTFTSMSSDGYFEPVQPNATQTTVTVSSTTPSLGQVVTLTAKVVTPAGAATDGGGNVTFLVDGQPIPGCVGVALKDEGTCETSSLTQGNHVITAAYSGDVQYKASNSTPFPADIAVGPLQSGLHQPAIPGPGKAYLGAWVRPIPLSQEPKGTSSVTEELSLLPGFNHPASGTMGRSLSIVHVYQAWTAPTPLNQLKGIMGNGAIPMVDWLCGDSDANIIAGKDDALIAQFANELAKLQGPVFLRWYFEPNFTASPTATTCLTGTGSPPNETGPAGYVGAWRHIHDIFTSAGATNVAFVWCMGTASGAAQDFIDFYPGSSYVDWITADGYYRSTTYKTNWFAQHFGTWYEDFQGFGKPLAITETATLPGAQGPYLTEIQSVLPTQFPMVQALAYFDSDAHAGLNDYPFDGPGLAAFQGLSNDPHFQPALEPTSVQTATISPARPLRGQEVQLTAPVSTTDLGGSLAFYANGSSTPIPGCELVVISITTSCNTDLLPVGTDSVTATYSGDSEFAPSTATPLSVQVADQPAAGQTGAPPVPSVGHAYLGGWVDPTGGGPRPGIELTNLPSFDAALARPLSIAHLYQSWAAPTPASTIQQVWIDGSMPMIDWSCGDSVVNIASGRDDPLITAVAHELAGLRFPMFLRWFWEPNLLGSTQSLQCLGGLGSAAPQDYALAFEHIHNIFQAAGASNVAFVWSVATGGSQVDLTGYYPGSAYVDWIAADGYERTASPGPNGARNVFRNWYATFSQAAYGGKPLMISETGAYAGGQAAYLAQLMSLLPTWPQIRAVAYFDAPGRYQSETYSLDASGTKEFAALSRTAYFQPPRQATYVTLSESASTVAAPNSVQLTAGFSSTDMGGHLTYYANGVAIPGCELVPLTGISSCTTDALPGGLDALTVGYSGDPFYSGAVSPSVPETVIAPAVPGYGGTGAAFLGVPSLSPVRAQNFAAPHTSGDVAGGPEAAFTGGRPGAVYSFSPAGGPSAGQSFGLLAVLIALALAACFGTYILITWVTDQRRLRALPVTETTES